MLILGLDPGVATTGYGLIHHHLDRDLKVHSYGWIETPKIMDQSNRLVSIEKQITDLICREKPDVVSLEKLFFFANAKTAMMVSEAIGVIKLSIQKLNIPLFEYAPLRMKKIVTGNGRAKKPEVKEAVRQILGTIAPSAKKTYFDDVADALALAICHSISITNPEPLTRKPKKKGGERSWPTLKSVPLPITLTKSKSPFLK